MGEENKDNRDNQQIMNIVNDVFGGTHGIVEIYSQLSSLPLNCISDHFYER